MPRDVFISYKTEDRELAERLCAALERENLSCWIAPRDIPPGQEWASAIVQGIQSSKSFVLLLSSHSIAAKQISREAELADSQNIPILTFRLEEIQPPRELLYFLGNLQWLDAFGGAFDTAAARLAAVIRSAASTAGEAPAAFARTPPPAAPVKRNSYLLPVAGGLIALLALGAWLGLRPRTEPSADGRTASDGEVEKMELAKAAADKLLKDRDSGNFDVAWNELSVSFRDRNDRATWQTSTENRNHSHGGVTLQKFRKCRTGQPDVYICEYTLECKDGARFRDELWVVRNPAGGWWVDQGKVRAEQ